MSWIVKIVAYWIVRSRPFFRLAEMKKNKQSSQNALQWLCVFHIAIIMALPLFIGWRHWLMKSFVVFWLSFKFRLLDQRWK
jgi:hypothetical protein